MRPMKRGKINLNEKKRKSNRQLKIIGLVLILTVVLVSIVLIQSASPMRQAKKQGVALSREVAGIEEVTDFYWFTRDKTYFTVVGNDEKNVGKIVFLPQDGEEAVIMNQSDGIDDTTAIQNVLDLKETKKIKKISLGLYKNEAVWEVVANSNQGGINYYLVSFKDGKILNTIKDI